MKIISYYGTYRIKEVSEIWQKIKIKMIHTIVYSYITNRTKYNKKVDAEQLFMQTNSKYVNKSWKIIKRIWRNSDVYLL